MILEAVLREIMTLAPRSLPRVDPPLSPPPPPPKPLPVQLPVGVEKPVSTLKSELLRDWLLEDTERLKLSGAKIAEICGLDIKQTQANVVKAQLKKELQIA